MRPPAVFHINGFPGNQYSIPNGLFKDRPPKKTKKDRTGTIMPHMFFLGAPLQEWRIFHCYPFARKKFRSLKMPGTAVY